jgi:hypothetical protein
MGMVPNLGGLSPPEHRHELSNDFWIEARGLLAWIKILVRSITIAPPSHNLAISVPSSCHPRRGTSDSHESDRQEIEKMRGTTPVAKLNSPHADLLARKTLDFSVLA